jgi:outer membrane murein-binding lipoprotein Lpp
MMLDELDALAGKLTELSARVRMLRAENLQLRSQLAAANAETLALRERAAAATNRLDALLTSLSPPPTSGSVHDTNAVSRPSEV